MEEEVKETNNKVFKPNPMLIPISIIIAGAIIAGAIIYNGRLAASTAATVAATAASNSATSTVTPTDSLGLPTTTVTVPLAVSHTEGSSKAKVAVIEFGDYECPYCDQTFKQVEPGLTTNYINPGKVLFAFKEYPLTTIHPYAQIQAEGAECAGDQSKYWQMHDALYNSGQQNDATALEAMAKTIGLNVATFTSCLTAKTPDNVIQEDTTQGNNVGMQGTPFFVIGKINTKNNTVTGTEIPGAFPYTTFTAVLAKYL